VINQETKSNVFSKIKNYSLDFYSLATHFPYYVVKKMNNLKTTAEELEYNKLIKETWYRNEERLFRVLAKMLTNSEYIKLLESDSFKSFVEEKLKNNWTPEEAIGLTQDFIESTYFTDLVRNREFNDLAKSFFTALPESIKKGLEIKLVNLAKNLDFNRLKSGGSNSSITNKIAGVLEGGTGLVAGLVGGFAVFAFFSAAIGILITSIPAILCAYNYYKSVQMESQRNSLSILRSKMEEIKQENKDNDNEVEK